MDNKTDKSSTMSENEKKPPEVKNYFTSLAVLEHFHEHKPGSAVSALVGYEVAFQAKTRRLKAPCDRLQGGSLEKNRRIYQIGWRFSLSL